MKNIRRLLQSQIVAIILILSMAGVCYSAGNTTVAVSATVLSKSNCRFINPATAALNFSSLDPANPVDKTVNAAIGFRCGGSAPMATFFISDNDGLHETGPNANRMRHAAVLTEFIPYSLTLNPTSATVPKNTNQTLTISGTVLGVNYQNAYAGSYSDTVVLTITP